MAKLLTAEQIAAKKNVDAEMVTAVGVKKQEILQEPRGVVTPLGDIYVWALWVTILGERKRIVTCELTFKTPEEAAKHCRRLMGIAWNLEVEVPES